MLHLFSKPDTIFRLFFVEAMDDMLRGSRSDSDLPVTLLEIGSLHPIQESPHPKELIRQVQELKASFLDDTKLYQLTAEHWVVLYEYLQRYCIVVNEMPEVSRLCEEYGISLVDFDGLITRYFGDTDDFGYPTGGFTTEQRNMLLDLDADDDFSPRAWLEPQPNRAVMTVCPEEWRHKFQNSKPISFPIE